MSEGPRRILVADADEGTRTQVRLTLAGELYDVVEAGDTEAAIRHIAALLPDLVLLDLGLPGAGGLRLTRSLKAQPETRPAVVVLLYDRADGIDDQATAQAGVDALLAKPFTSLGLLAKVDTLLDRGAELGRGAADARRSVPEGPDSP